MSQEKQILRKQIKSILREMSDEERNLQSREVCRCILESRDFAECDAVISYMALWDEVELSDVNERAFCGKMLVLPRVTDALGGEMGFFCVRGDRPLSRKQEMSGGTDSSFEKECSPGGQTPVMETNSDRGDRPLSYFLETGSYNIKEPDVNRTVPLDPKILAGKKVLCLVPGVAFTKEGWRMGRGKGFYDRALSKLKKESAEVGFELKTIGISFTTQLVEKLPVEENDVRLDGIITPDQFFESAE